MDQNTVTLIEKFNGFFVSICTAINLAKRQPDKYKLNNDNLYDMLSENQILALQWLELHAIEEVDPVKGQYHYFPKADIN